MESGRASSAGILCPTCGEPMQSFPRLDGVGRVLLCRSCPAPATAPSRPTQSQAVAPVREAESASRFRVLTKSAANWSAAAQATRPASRGGTGRLPGLGPCPHCRAAIPVNSSRCSWCGKSIERGSPS